MQAQGSGLSVGNVKHHAESSAAGSQLSPKMHVVLGMRCQEAISTEQSWWLQGGAHSSVGEGLAEHP